MINTKLWSQQENEEYEKIRVHNSELDVLYETAKVYEPILRTAFLARILTLTVDDYIKIENEVDGKRPEHLRKLEEMFVARQVKA